MCEVFVLSRLGEPGLARALSGCLFLPEARGEAERSIRPGLAAKAGEAPAKEKPAFPGFKLELGLRGEDSGCFLLGGSEGGGARFRIRADGCPGQLFGASAPGDLPRAEFPFFVLGLYRGHWRRELKAAGAVLSVVTR